MYLVALHAESHGSRSGRGRQRSAAAEFGLSLVSFSSARVESFSHLHALHAVSALHTGCVCVCV